METNKEKDILYFVSFCIEEYKKHTGKTGREISSLFEECDIYPYLRNNYDTLHTQGSHWLMAEIDEYVKNKQR